MLDFNKYIAIFNLNLIKDLINKKQNKNANCNTWKIFVEPTQHEFSHDNKDDTVTRDKHRENRIFHASFHVEYMPIENLTSAISWILMPNEVS